jgi:hypothetical protein
MVEFAFVLPLLLMLLVGIWSTARAWNVHNVMDHAAREAARHGATVEPWNGSSPTTVRAVADAALSASRVDVGLVFHCIDMGANPCNADPANLVSDDVVAVTLMYPNYPLDFVFFSTEVDLEVSAIARYES